MPDVCPNDSQYNRANITVRDVAAQTIQYNGSDSRAESTESSCAVLELDEDSQYQY